MRVLSALALVVIAFSSFVFAQNVTTPRPVSPAAEVKQRIGLTDIRINYSRPRVTLNGVDRTGKIWGALVPYGMTKSQFGKQMDMPWRAGANENTIFEISHDATVEGKPLKAGKYSLHMIVNQNQTVTLIFNSATESWGSFFYDPKEDVMRVDTKMRDNPHTEVLTYSFPEVGNDYVVVELAWERKAIPFKVAVDVHSVVLANFRNELRNLPGFGWQGFQTAAQYCLTNNINNAEAIEWADVAIARNRTFPTLATKANLLFQGGKQTEGDAILADALKIANRLQINNVGYQMLGINRFDKAIEILKLNVESDPTDANAWDSVGEAYKMAGDKANAIKYLRKALELNPPANVRANSIKLLKELGEDVQ
ncbi:MAG: DUF2911 domain-containing protein [Pyrinomonadaceae bacterium]